MKTLYYTYVVCIHTYHTCVVLWAIPVHCTAHSLTWLQRRMSRVSRAVHPATAASRSADEMGHPWRATEQQREQGEARRWGSRLTDQEGAPTKVAQGVENLESSNATYQNH